jgi:hypothetical protein
MTFTLSPKEELALSEFKAKVYKKHKKYGSFTIMFTPTAIGNVVEVRSGLTGKTKDITDYSCW